MQQKQVEKQVIITPVGLNNIVENECEKDNNDSAK